MWYYLYSSTGKREIKIELESRSPKLYDFFVHNNDNGITDYIRLRAKAQNGLTKKLLESLDYLEVLNWNIPVFSGRFVDKLGDSLKNSLTFFPCEI